MHGTSVAPRCAGLSLLYLGGSLAATFPLMLLVGGVAPALTEGRLGRATFFGTMALLCGAGGMLWGAHLARLTEPRHGTAWAVGAALGYGTSAPLATSFASVAETFLLDRAQQGVEYPMHLAFALIFAVVLLLVVGVTALAVGLASGGGWRHALRLAAVGAGTAVGSFLAVDVAFDLAGWRVGAPGAEQRATMLVVLGVGLLAATAAAGAALGRTLARATSATRASGEAPEPAR